MLHPVSVHADAAVSFERRRTCTSTSFSYGELCYTESAIQIQANFRIMTEGVERRPRRYPSLVRSLLWGYYAHYVAGWVFNWHGAYKLIFDTTLYI